MSSVMFRLLARGLSCVRVCIGPGERPVGDRPGQINPAPHFFARSERPHP